MVQSAKPSVTDRPDELPRKVAFPEVDSLSALDIECGRLLAPLPPHAVSRSIPLARRPQLCERV